MNYTLVAIPTEKDLTILNDLRNYVYQNDFRFRNKPLDSDTHITLTALLMNEAKTEELKQLIEKNIDRLILFLDTSTGLSLK